MKKYLFVLAALMLFSACDDGEFIVTSFNFDSNSDLKFCKTESTTVCYIVNANPSESIAFNFPDTSFDGTYDDPADSLVTTIALNGTNRLVYRTYNGTLHGDAYFCSGIPPTQPEIKEEYVSGNGGSIDLIVTFLEAEQHQSPTGDTIVTKTFRTRAVAHDVTLKNISNAEEIVVETLFLGSFTKTRDFNLSNPSNGG